MDRDVKISGETDLALEAPVPLIQHPAAVYLSSLSPSSRRTMNCALDRMAGWLSGGKCDALSLDWSKLRYLHTAAVRSLLVELYAPATANRMLAALRRVLLEARRLGLLSADLHFHATQLEAVRGDSPLRGRALAPTEIAALLNACSDGTPIGYRDKAAIAILAGAGLRRAELVGLDLKDYDGTRAELDVVGKGNKFRTTYLPEGSIRTIDDWLRVRGREPGPLLCPVHRSGKVRLKRLNAQAIVWRLQARGQQAGVSSFSAHDFRRTFIGNLLDGGTDIVTVQKLVGHSDVSTTARYDRRGEAAKRAAVEQLDIPY